MGFICSKKSNVIFSVYESELGLIGFTKNETLF